jgi:hypothetical protein
MAAFLASAIALLPDTPLKPSLKQTTDDRVVPQLTARAQSCTPKNMSANYKRVTNIK